ncbi:MAG: hypothetical protein COT90_04915 [Candidatus Diapherotrites archaeon CG10_big_fil_rev_8_21_14_0_10_31_34]|nr:MAG: hypothetical protein COT90_04915 [Candidatus Diapherotrites archaeon CG10_big_fil_rev_8_21_14_0_10_31_34]
MNPLNIFYQPGTVVKHYLENPNLAKAVFFVLLPGILSVLGLLIYGLNIDFFLEIFNLLLAVLAWIIASILIVLIITLFARKSVRTEFYGIASAVSLTRLLGAAAVFLFLLIPIILPGEIFSSVKEFQTGAVTLSESADNISVAMDSDAFLSAVPIVSAIVLLTVIFAVLSVLVYYKIISKHVNSNILVHSIALICFLVLDLIFMKIIGF